MAKTATTPAPRARTRKATEEAQSAPETAEVEAEATTAPAGEDAPETAAPEPEFRRMTQPEIEATARAVGAIQGERIRAVQVKGHTAEGDDEFSDGELARAAACLCRLAAGEDDGELEAEWPFEESRMLKEDDTPERQLARAGSFIIAELERLHRLNAS